MTNDVFHLPVAQSGLTFLIYLIAGILWLLGNMSQQKKAKQRAEEMRRRREEREREEERTGKKTRKPHPLEQDLETLLGRLSGDTTAGREPEPPPPLPSPAPSRTPAPPPPPTRQPIAESVKTPKTDIGAMDLADSYEEMKDIEDALEISYEQLEGKVRGQTLETVRQVMVDLSPTMIDFARLPVQRMRAVEGNTTPPALKNRKAFKKALLGAAILGPPVALQDPTNHER
jgi:hypothetical protein